MDLGSTKTGDQNAPFFPIWAQRMAHGASPAKEMVLPQRSAKKWRLSAPCLFWLQPLAWLTSHPESRETGTSTGRLGAAQTVSRQCWDLLSLSRRETRQGSGRGTAKEPRSVPGGLPRGLFLLWVTQKSWEKLEERGREAGKGTWMLAENFNFCNSTMVSGNLPVWVILLVPLSFWASESLQMGPPGTAEPTSKQTSKTIQTFQTVLLKRLGLQRRPDPKPELRVPQYLLDLYWFSSRQLPASPRDTEQPFLEGRAAAANTVRTFHHVEDSADASAGAGDSFYFLFNLSALPLEEELTALELRLYHSPKESQASYIHIYHAMDPPPVAPNKSRLLACQFVTPSQPQWVSFDVTAAFQTARERKRDLGLLVEVQPSNRSQDLPRQQSPLRARRSPGQEEAQWARERPLLVTYSHDRRGKPLTQRKRQSRSRPVRGRGGAAKVQASARKHKGPRPRQAKSSTRCRRHRLFVDFKAVGWNDWIIAPSGYHAFYCSGDCRFPLADHMNSSSHAVVQTILNSVNAKVPKACCVPTELSPIAMLYLDQNDMVVLKSYQDMVVEGCGCR